MRTYIGLSGKNMITQFGNSVLAFERPSLWLLCFRMAFWNV